MEEAVEIAGEPLLGGPLVVEADDEIPRVPVEAELVIGPKLLGREQSGDVGRGNMIVVEAPVQPRIPADVIG